MLRVLCPHHRHVSHVVCESHQSSEEAALNSVFADEETDMQRGRPRGSSRVM